MTFIYWMLYTAGADSPGFSPSNGKDFFSAVEWEHLARMRFALRRNSFVLGRKATKGLLQGCCSELKEIPKNRISIENDASGAPYARVDGKRLPGRLSISHSGVRAFCAYTEDNIGIGVDLEEIQPRSKSFLLDYFTPAEIAEAESQPLERQALWITAAWSAKEAVLKALQTGLRVDTRQVAISFPETDKLAKDTPAWIPFLVNKAPEPAYQWQGWWRVDEQQVLTLVQARMDLLESPPVLKEIPA